MADAPDIAARLRNACVKVRRQSMPLADLIPLLQQAADALSATPSPPVAAPAATPVAHPNLGAAPQNGWDAWTHAAQPQPQPAQPLTGAGQTVTIITSPNSGHRWIADSAEEVAHFSLPGQGHKIEVYTLAAPSTPTPPYGETP